MEKNEIRAVDRAHDLERIVEQDGWEVITPKTSFGDYDRVKLDIRSPENDYETSISVSRKYIFAKEFDPSVAIKDSAKKFIHSPLAMRIAEYAKNERLKMSPGYLIDGFA